MSNASLLLARSALHAAYRIGKGILAGGISIEIFQSLEKFHFFHGHAPLTAVHGCDPFLNCSPVFFAERLDQTMFCLWGGPNSAARAAVAAEWHHASPASSLLSIWNVVYHHRHDDFAIVVAGIAHDVPESRFAFDFRTSLFVRMFLHRPFYGGEHAR
jgi:hypothetical protein